jgi:hypothetical protein
MSEKKEPFHFSHIAESMIGDLRGVPFREPARMRKRPTKDLAPIVDELLVKFHVGRHSPEDSIREKWIQIVGHANASYSHPVSIDAKNCLLVHVAHSVVRSELILHRAKILAEIQRLSGCGHVKNILFRAG